MTTTIKDVARAASVSIATVSHVLNGTHYVSPKLCERVWDAVKETGYCRNPVAHGLRTGRTNLLGLMVADLAALSFPSIVRGAQDVAAAAGYSLVLLRPEGPGAQHLLAMARRGMVEGLVLDVAGIPASDVAALSESGIPTVAMSSNAEHWDIDVVVTDEAGGVCLAVEHLVELGHQRIGFVGGLPDSQTAAARYAGYRQALARHGLAYDPAIVAEAPLTRYGGYRGAKSVLAAPSRPTALIAADDSLAAGALLALQDAGLRVPDDVSLVGCDDVRVADLMTPTLTSLALPWYEMGAQAAKMLLERVSGYENGPGRTITLAPKLVRRQSTAAPST
jgi:LacI family transcriptional regulator